MAAKKKSAAKKMSKKGMKKTKGGSFTFNQLGYGGGSARQAVVLPYIEQDNAKATGGAGSGIVQTPGL